LRQGFEHDIPAMAMRDNVTTPTLIPKAAHIVSELGCSVGAINPIILARPMKTLVALAAVCPTPSH
jgi:hypothetical protein